MATKRSSRATKDAPWVKAAVLEFRINANFTMVVSTEALKKRQKEGKDTFVRENEFSYTVVPHSTHGKVLRLDADCVFEAEVKEEGKRAKTYRHRVTAVGILNLLDESTKLEIGADLKLEQVWPYMSMFIWWIKQSAMEQFHRVGAPYLEIPMPSMEDLEKGRMA